MKKNMGNIDRTIRVLVALTIAVLIFTGVIEGTVMIILAVVAIIFLVTSLVSFCPLYRLFGISSRQT